MKGIVVGNISNLYYVEINDQIYEATARGKFKKDNVSPVVGDNVELEILDDDKKIAIINEICQRYTYIKRPKLSNISQLVFVLSTKNPKPDLLMLDKQIAYAEYLKIKPIIVINKIDLSDNYKVIEEIYKSVGYEVLLTVAKENKGIDKLKEILNCKISAFSGNSGVGKSTIINALFGTNMTQEGEISKKNKRGKNTTTSVELYKIDNNSYIADTPGFSNFDISEIESKELQNYFIEFRNYIPNCEFVGCTHIKEENCGIKEALATNNITQDRYDRFCTIYNEIKEKEERRW